MGSSIGVRDDFQTAGWGNVDFDDRMVCIRESVLLEGEIKMSNAKTRYTTLQSALDFVGKSASDIRKFSYQHSVELVKSLEGLSQENPDIEIRYRMGDGILLFYQGVSRMLLLQTRNYIRMIIWDRGDLFSEALLKWIGESPGGFSVKHDPRYRQWRLCPAGARQLAQFLGNLPKPSSLQQGPRNLRHARYFSSEVRRLAFDQFASDGYRCPGFAREPHKLNIDAGERIEYDHILPAAKGGSSSEFNVQVMCETCNRKKRDHIA
jgi:5-methylcytosine-specific restriction endonuclease McrA